MKTIIDIYNYKNQNNIAVDMCVACIQHNFYYGKNLKEIVLSNAYYAIFQKWVRQNYDEETAELEFAIEGVFIRKEAIISGKSLIEVYG